MLPGLRRSACMTSAGRFFSMMPRNGRRTMRRGFHPRAGQLLGYLDADKAGRTGDQYFFHEYP